MNKKKRIGVVVDRMDGIHQQNLCRSLNKLARKYSFELLFFSGVSINQPLWEDAEFNIVYDLPIGKDIDGFILILCSFATYLGYEDMNRVAKKYMAYPVVSLSVPIESAYTIMLDNKDAMTSILDHVSSHVNPFDIAFVSGPATNVEATERLNLYKAYLEGRGQTPQKNYIYEGTFLKESGHAAVEFFYQSNEFMPKAIVCANDEMALGAFERLTELGLSVPGDVLLTGFDNIEAAIEFFPPMTTYKQDIQGMCQAALDQLLLMVDSGQISGLQHIPGELIVRESCGCLQERKLIIERPKNHIYEAAHEEFSSIEHMKWHLMDRLSEFRELIRVKIGVNYSHMSFDKKYAELIVEAIIEDIEKSRYYGETIRVLSQLVNISLNLRQIELDLFGFVGDLRSITMACVVDNTIYGPVTELFLNIENYVGDRLVRLERNRALKIKNLYLTGHQFVKEVMMTSTISDLYDILTKYLKSFGVRACGINLFAEPITWVVNMEDDQVLTFPDDMISTFLYVDGKIDKDHPFDVTKLYDFGRFSTSSNTYIFLSLFYEAKQYGYVVFSYDAYDEFIYEVIRSKVAETLHRGRVEYERKTALEERARVLKELEKSNQILSHMSKVDELTGLLNRRGFYEMGLAYMEEAKDKNKRFHVIFGDLDRLKRINDQYGHKEGDFALRSIAGILQDASRGRGIVARMSGDEFIILVTEDKETIVLEVLEQIKKMCHDHNQVHKKAYDLSISCGYHPYEPSMGLSLDELLNRADKKLYKEKNSRLF